MSVLSTGNAVGQHLEQWRSIAAFPKYEVSDAGRVRSLYSREPRVLKAQVRPNGYYSVNLYRFGAMSTELIHALVATAFHGPRPEGQQVRHLDGDKSNNTPANLAWGTSSENHLDRVRHGTHHHAAKTACIHGHPFDEANTMRRGPDGRWRMCRACSYAKNRAAYQRKAAA